MIKKLLVFSIILLSYPLAINAQVRNKTRLYITSDLDTLGREEFLQESYRYSTWNSKRSENSDTLFIPINEDRFGIYLLNYDKIKTRIEQTINKKYIVEKPTFLIKYEFLNDRCNHSRGSNHFDTSDIYFLYRYQKRELKKIREEIGEIEIIYLFEEGISFDRIKKEIFIRSDKDNYFRNNFFTTPTSCGSYFLIKPNGQALLMNTGEYGLYNFAKYLEPKRWEIYFNDHQLNKI